MLRESVLSSRKYGALDEDRYREIISGSTHVIPLYPVLCHHNYIY